MSQSQPDMMVNRLSNLAGSLSSFSFLKHYPSPDGSQEESKWLPDLLNPYKALQSARKRYKLSMLASVILLLYLWTHYSPQAPRVTSYIPRTIPMFSKSTGHLPHIPPYIWQIHGYRTEPRVEESIMNYQNYILSWVSHSPSYSYHILDRTGADALMAQLSRSPDKQIAYLAAIYAVLLQHQGMAADFLRYLLLALEGGVYSDIDTTLLRPIHDWVPADLKAKTKLIVGIEFDQRHDKELWKVSDDVEFCEWTLAAAAGHELMWAMVNWIAGKVVETAAERARVQDSSDKDVLGITGSTGWTREVFKALSRAAGGEIDWRNITGLKEPRLYGDILVLPINGFGTGQEHSGSVKGGSKDALVKHHFERSWREFW